MDEVIKAFLETGVTVEDVLSFASNFGVLDHPEIQHVLGELLYRDTRAASPPTFTETECDHLLDVLKSPEPR